MRATRLRFTPGRFAREASFPTRRRICSAHLWTRVITTLYIVAMSAYTRPDDGSWTVYVAVPARTAWRRRGRKRCRSGSRCQRHSRTAVHGGMSADSANRPAVATHMWGAVRAAAARVVSTHPTMWGTVRCNCWDAQSMTKPREQLPLSPTKPPRAAHPAGHVHELRTADPPPPSSGVRSRQ
jgi:hypothetical protein